MIHHRFVVRIARFSKHRLMSCDSLFTICSCAILPDLISQPRKCDFQQLIEGCSCICFGIIERLICQVPMRCQCDPVGVLSPANVTGVLGLQFVNNPPQILPPPIIPGIEPAEINHSRGGCSQHQAGSSIPFQKSGSFVMNSNASTSRWKLLCVCPRIRRTGSCLAPSA